ncbi:MAG: hypothetical protein ACE5F1_04690 [Planctomycetota bacterium]
MEIRAHEVTRVKSLGAGYHVLYLHGPFSPARPGQFCMLSLKEAWPCLFPRPFSYFDVVPGADGFASFLVKVAGPGSRALALVEPGRRVLVTGPLGRPFPPAADPEPVCIAGGVGLAPFLLWAKDRQRDGRRALILYGAATAEALVGYEEFPPGAQDWQLASEDGSRGFHGTVLDLYRSLLAGPAGVHPGRPVYCCGPDAMMQAVQAECAGLETPCFVSLENVMACGYGVCNGCTVRVQRAGRFADRISGYSRSCVEGPVYDATELVW